MAPCPAEALRNYVNGASCQQEGVLQEVDDCHAEVVRRLDVMQLDEATREDKQLGRERRFEEDEGLESRCEEVDNVEVVQFRIPHHAPPSARRFRDHVDADDARQDDVIFHELGRFGRLDFKLESYDELQEALGLGLCFCPRHPVLRISAAFFADLFSLTWPYFSTFARVYRLLRALAFSVLLAVDGGPSSSLATGADSMKLAI